MIRIAVVEDEPVFARQMQEHLERYQKERGENLRITLFSDGDEIVEKYSGEYDIIFMDVQMQFLDGMKTAEIIRQLDSEVIIIFITNMPQYAIKGYAVGAMDYVLKPLSYFALSQRLDKAISRMRKREKRYLMISTAGEVRKVDVSQLYYVESQNHSLVFHTREGDFIASGTMRQMENTLAEGGSFFRCNKGCLVNLEYVEAIRDHCAIVNGVTLPISRGKKSAMMEALTNYVNGVVR